MPWADERAIFCQGKSMEFVASTGVGDSGIEVNLVACTNDLDVETVDQFKENVLPMLCEGQHPLIVDLSGVAFVDSTGLGGLITALKRARESQVGLDLVVNTERVSRLLAITGLDVLLPIYESRELALASN